MTPNTSVGSATPRDPAHRGQIQRQRIQFLTVAAVAEFIDVSERTVRRWIKSGELVAHHFGTAVRIAESDFKAFVARRRDP